MNNLNLFNGLCIFVCTLRFSIQSNPLVGSNVEIRTLLFRLLHLKSFWAQSLIFIHFFKYVNLMEICQLTDQPVLDSMGQRLGIVRCNSL